MNSKIIGGIVVGIAIIVVVFGFATSENELEEVVELNELEIISDSTEGQQFSLELSDTVNTKGP